MPKRPKAFRPRLARQQAKRTSSAPLRKWRYTKPNGLREFAKVRVDMMCEECKRQGRITPGEEVDHIIPRQLRPDLTYDPDNLQYLCKPCHQAKTAKEQGASKAK